MSQKKNKLRKDWKSSISTQEQTIRSKTKINRNLIIEDLLIIIWPNLYWSSCHFKILASNMDRVEELQMYWVLNISGFVTNFNWNIWDWGIQAWEIFTIQYIMACGQIS